MSYKLRCSLLGHSTDIRSVATSQNYIVSGSRDMTAKLWTPNSFDQRYQEEKCFSVHTNFVNAACVVSPNEQFPNGLVLTASSDKSICAFDFESETPRYRLIGHENVVCAVVVGKFGTIVSGSWDSTAKTWFNGSCLYTLKGHNGTVWAVEIMSHNGLIITGSADKTVKVWKSGVCTQTFIGHSDCVRGLAVLSETCILSSANDGTIRQWSLSGDCQAVYEGHESFVYCIAALPSGSGFVTGGEDRSVRVWKDGKCSQVIRLPAQSVWSVATLPNGDIVTGTSDGTVRVFTSVPELRASPEELKAFDDELAKSTISTNEIGNIKVNELPGKESLFEPGKRDGQTKLVKEDGKVGVYQWNAEEFQWLKIGDAVGSADGSTSSNKIHYEGKEYDYVFDVDIEEGKPPLKLPYNITEDPWFAAQKFLDNHNISQLYLDEVANFIVKNTKGVTLGSSSASAYEDPFTGASRYKPGSGAPLPQGTARSSDPFTGSGRYIPTEGEQDVKVPATIDSQYFPRKLVLTFDVSSNRDAIKGKLVEFNQKQVINILPESALDSVLELINVNAQCTDSQLGTLDAMLQWPDSQLFPVLDILRLAIRIQSVNQKCCSESNGQSFFHMLFKHIQSFTSNSANCILSFKILCNMTCHEAGKSLFLSRRHDLIGSVMKMNICDNKSVQIACTTVLLNYAALLVNCSDDHETASELISAISFLLQNVSDKEAIFRLLVALGTQISSNLENVAIACSLDLINTVSEFVIDNNPNKIGECARDVMKVLQP